jgi:predicted glycogen debranching enzyme
MSRIAAPLETAGSLSVDLDRFVACEWLVTNGLGGYASGTVAGVITRGFHGYLISALPSPFGRVVMLNDLVEQLVLPGERIFHLGGEERVGEPLRVHGADYLIDFRLDAGLPIWLYEVEGYKLEKRLLMPHGQNTTFVRYTLLEAPGTVKLQVRPSINMRLQEAPVSTPLTSSYTLTVAENYYEVSNSSELPPLRLMMTGPDTALTVERQRIQEVLYRIEENRGYAARGDLWSPGYFCAELSKGQVTTLVASSETWDTIQALSPADAWDAEYHRRSRLLAEADPQARKGMGTELVYAADQFIITPAGRIEEAVRARAAGDEVRTVIAGYHWFTDWGRDTMISLEGLTLTTGRFIEASYILRTFARYIRNGLIPNMFPEGKSTGLYHTADATMWFFHAIDRYVELSGDRAMLAFLLPKLVDIVDWHMRGTDFNIGVDPSDGLLRQGQDGYQLTWMDAKVDGWVVTPRRGKAVEINALWYNALKLLESWLLELGRAPEAEAIGSRAAQVYESFNRRFWYAEGGYLYDVVDSEHTAADDCCRPNQVFAISLKYPVLDPQHWESVLRVVKDRLLTPLGLRSLAPGSKEYKSKYDGDLRSRDAAYHQGTVWAWLIGPFIDAWLKLYPDDIQTARQFLSGFEPHLNEACIGTISEIFDAEPPYAPRGCAAQAWSVAEVLRSFVKTAATTEPEGAQTEENVQLAHS